MRSLIRGCPATEREGSCNVNEGDCLAWACRDDSCDGCLIGDGLADGCFWPEEMQGNCDWYWSSSVVEGDDGLAWLVNYGDGDVNNEDFDFDHNVRCVR